MQPLKKSATPRRAPRKPHPTGTRDPLFNQSVQKAFAILDAFGGERRALNLGEIAAAVGVTKSSAQRISHTLQSLGYVRRDVRAKGWVLCPRVLTLGYAYLSGHALIEGATGHLQALNTAAGESFGSQTMLNISYMP